MAFEKQSTHTLLVLSENLVRGMMDCLDKDPDKPISKAGVTTRTRFAVSAALLKPFIVELQRRQIPIPAHIRELIKEVS